VRSVLLRLAVTSFLAALLAGVSPAADAPPRGRCVVRNEAVVRALGGRPVFDVQPGAAMVLGGGDFSRATTYDSASTVQWPGAFARAGRKWRLSGQSTAEPRVRIRATVAAKGRSLRVRLSGGLLRHAIRFKASRSPTAASSRRARHRTTRSRGSRASRRADGQSSTHQRRGSTSMASNGTTRTGASPA
jgi:hypothetical protein